jgi:hypothetical protein
MITKIEKWMQEGDQILWHGRSSPLIYLFNNGFAGLLLSAILALADAFIAWMIISVNGFTDFLLSLFSIFFPFLMIPFPIALYKFIQKAYFVRYKEYWITNRGIGIREGDRDPKHPEKILFYPFKSIGSIHEKPIMDDKGTVQFFHKTLMDPDPRSDAFALLAEFECISDCPNAVQLLYDLFATYQQENAACDEGTTQELTEFDAADGLPELPPDALPEESVADLQAELFGADAAQQGAFPDPTVNPLPELPDAQNDDKNGQFMQQGF